MKPSRTHWPSGPRSGKAVAMSYCGREQIEERPRLMRGPLAARRTEQQVNLAGLVERAGERRRSIRNGSRAGKKELGAQPFRRPARRFPFPQRLCIARRHIGIIGVGADRVSGFSTSARTFFLPRDSARPPRPRPPAGEKRRWALVLDESRRRGNAHFRKIAIDHRFIQLRVRHVHNRVGLE